MTKKIGIVGGLGPYAGLDLVKKIFDLTSAETDQEHLGVNLLSLPSEVPDRTEFILGKSNINPATSIYRLINKLEVIGMEVVGIPCNTTHSEIIFSEIVKLLKNNGSNVKLVNMVHEVAYYIKQNYPEVSKIGILSTLGTVKSRIYSEIFSVFDIDVFYPDQETQDLVHLSIYDKVYGIKANSADISENAKDIIRNATLHLGEFDVDCVVLACTELPLAVTEKDVNGIKLINPSLILAQALIKYAQE